MEFIRRLKSLQFIFRPSFWISNDPVNWGWDARIRELIDNKAEAEQLGEHRALIGDAHVWTSNYPYAYGYRADGRDGLPSRLTRIELREYLGKYAK